MKSIRTVQGDIQSVKSGGSRCSIFESWRRRRFCVKTVEREDDVDWKRAEVALTEAIPSAG